MTAIVLDASSDAQEITLRLPSASIARLNAAVDSQHASPDSVVTELIDNHLPLLKREGETEFDRRVQEFSMLSEEQLQKHIEAKLTQPEQTRLSQLTAKNKQAALSEQEVQERETLLNRVEAVETMRAAAMWLLQQRSKTTTKS